MRTRTLPQILTAAVAAVALSSGAAHAQSPPLPGVAFTETAVDVTEGTPRDVTILRVPSGRGTSLGPASLALQAVPQGTPGATNGTDFKIPAVVDFADGETRKTVSIDALSDSVTEQPEAFTLSAVEGRGDVDRGAMASVTVTIKDPPPRVTQQQGGNGTGNNTGQPTTADTMSPTIGNLVLAPSRFRPGRSGTTIVYSVSEPAQVTFRVERLSRKRRFVPAGTLAQAGQAGVNQLSFNGSIGGRKLSPGAYRLTATAVDAAGNSSTSAPRRFRLLR
jgi:hypothetical protein